MRKAFTLIELLVVISIIALLVAILMPALNRARQQATAAVCLGNQKALILAYLMYANDNEDRLVGGYAHEEDPYAWVYPPMDENGVADSSRRDVTEQDRFRGVRAGKLYPYTNTVDVYHCPADPRWRKGNKRFPPEPYYHMYRSYAIPDALRAEARAKGAGNGDILKLSQIKPPTQMYIFVEDLYDGQASNCDSLGWSFDPSADYEWWDPVGLLHNNACTLSFADGHAEMHKWLDERTIRYFTDRSSIPSQQSGNPDIKYMVRGYISNSRW